MNPPNEVDQVTRNKYNVLSTKKGTVDRINGSMTKRFYFGFGNTDYELWILNAPKLSNLLSGSTATMDQPLESTKY